ncbi:hypothetical protein [Achromobacter sp. UMC71]|uniref:hypothetical protein n=1 Tax=Achromobacter sp. UMC71 TaxID=1862320 RepID=UPI0015FFDE0E|nr:hypothetical protein [Achromobacter sp. UMC71]
MSTFDALMPSGTTSAGSTRSGGGSGDWRQAVEQAQAQSWLRDRSLGARQERVPPGPGESATPARPAAGRAEQTGTPFTGPLDEAPAPLSAPGAHGAPIAAARLTSGAGAAAQAVLPIPLACMPPLAAASTNPRGVAALPAAMAGQGEVLRSARTRKQSIHAECGEQGVSVWIRDASLNSREASHLAAAIASSLLSGRQDVASLYLNGRPVVDGSQLSSPKPSE